MNKLVLLFFNTLNIIIANYPSTLITLVLVKVVNLLYFLLAYAPNLRLHKKENMQKIY